MNLSLFSLFYAFDLLYSSPTKLFHFLFINSNSCQLLIQSNAPTGIFPQNLLFICTFLPFVSYISQRGLFAPSEGTKSIPFLIGFIICFVLLCRVTWAIQKMKRILLLILSWVKNITFFLRQVLLRLWKETKLTEFMNGCWCCLRIRHGLNIMKILHGLSLPRITQLS